MTVTTAVGGMLIGLLVITAFVVMLLDCRSGRRRSFSDIQLSEHIVAASGERGDTRGFQEGMRARRHVGRTPPQSDIFTLQHPTLSLINHYHHTPPPTGV